MGPFCRVLPYRLQPRNVLPRNNSARSSICSGGRRMKGGHVMCGRGLLDELVNGHAFHGLDDQLAWHTQVQAHEVRAVRDIEGSVAHDDASLRCHVVSVAVVPVPAMFTHGR